jgi:hypothetical protein
MPLPLPRGELASRCCTFTSSQFENGTVCEPHWIVHTLVNVSEDFSANDSRKASLSLIRVKRDSHALSKAVVMTTATTVVGPAKVQCGSGTRNGSRCATFVAMVQTTHLWEGDDGACGPRKSDHRS